jgi:hypothetical protein
VKLDEREMRWEELSRLVESLGPGWLFRGQQDARWELKTSLERHTPPERSQSEAEDLLLREFRRRAHVYLQPHHIPDDQGEWLAVMQHFGAPTRLLDVTKSPFVALYFAIEDATDPDRDCAVWAFNRTWCVCSIGESIFKANPKARESMQELIDKGVEIRSKDPAFAVGYYAVGSGERWPSKIQWTGRIPLCAGAPERKAINSAGRIPCSGGHDRIVHGECAGGSEHCRITPYQVRYVEPRAGKSS